MNESRDNDTVTDRDVVSVLEATFGVPRKSLTLAEFPVYVHLRFGLLVPPSFVGPHFERLLSAKGTNAPEYLGPELLAVYLAAGADEDVARQAEQAEACIDAARRRASSGGGAVIGESGD